MESREIKYCKIDETNISYTLNKYFTQIIPSYVLIEEKSTEGGYWGFIFLFNNYRISFEGMRLDLIVKIEDIHTGIIVDNYKLFDTKYGKDYFKGYTTNYNQEWLWINLEIVFEFLMQKFPKEVLMHQKYNSMDEILKEFEAERNAKKWWRSLFKFGS
jgi:hypothetical protein